MLRLCAIAGLLVAAIISIQFLRVPQKPEPAYAGKSVDEWLNAGQEDTCFALHDIGPPALPCILAKLEREDPQYGTSSRYRRFWTSLPIPFRHALPKPRATNFDETRACNALMELGPRIIPNLGQELECENPAVRSVSAQALCLWRERGKDISAAAPALKAATHDPDQRIARTAASALGLVWNPNP